MADMLEEMYRDWNVICPDGSITKEALRKFREEKHIIAEEYFKPSPLPRIQLFTRLMLGYPWRDYVISFVNFLHPNSISCISGNFFLSLKSLAPMPQH